jgi:hypothetical protein
MTKKVVGVFAFSTRRASNTPKSNDIRDIEKPLFRIFKYFAANLISKFNGKYDWNSCFIEFLMAPLM